MFRPLAILVLTLVALAVPFVHVPGTSVCLASANQDAPQSCCGSQCTSGCCAVDAATQEPACCAAHQKSESNSTGSTTSDSHCGGTCSGCACCVSIAIPVVLVPARGESPTVALLETLILQSEALDGLTRQPQVPPPDAA